MGRAVNQWDIYYCDLDRTQGLEQRSSRPVLVLSNNAVNHAIPVSTVAPLSSIKEGAKRIKKTSKKTMRGKAGMGIALV